jgi:hypothetical protein
MGPHKDENVLVSLVTVNLADKLVCRGGGLPVNLQDHIARL